MNLTWLFVGAVYAAAVFLARRAGVALPRRAALFFYLLTLLFFWKPLTGAFVNFQVDVLPTLPPWGHMTRYWHQFTSELNDLPLQIVPWSHQVRESWQSFSLPLWNHLNGSGYPLLGNAQSQALSLLRIVTLPLSLGHAVTAEAALKVLIALTFAFLWCNRRYSVIASATGAVTFGFCGFIIGWLHFPLATAACLAPAVMYCVELLLERVTFGRFVFAAALWTQLLFAGHPETAAHLFWLALMYVLWVAFVERKVERPGRFFLQLGGVMTVAALLAAPFLAPFLETVPRSKRIAELKANPLEADLLPYSDLPSFIVMFQPHFYGQVPLEHPWGPSNTDPLAGYTGAFAFAAWIALATWVVLTRNWRSRELFYVLMALFILGVAFAWPGVGELFHYTMPIAAHARVRLIFVLMLAISSAAAIDHARRTPMLIGVAAVAAALLVLLYRFPSPFAYRFDTAVLAMLPSLVALAAATVLAFFARKPAMLAVLVAVTAELFAIGRMRPTPLPERMLFPRTPMIGKLHELHAAAPPNAPFRIAGIGPQLFPNSNAIYGFEDVRAHDPMSYADYLAFLKLTADYDPWNYFAFLNDPSKSVFDFLNVRYVLLQPGANVGQPERYALVYDGRDGRIFENRSVLPRFYAVRNVLLEFRDEVFYPRLRQHDDWANTALLNALELETEAQRGDFFDPRPADAPVAVANIVRAEPADFEINVRAPRWSLVASSIPWWPGWKVTRNGERVKPIRVNAVFLGFAVPPGDSTVRVHYAPASFYAGAALSLSTMIAMVAVAIIRRRRGVAA